MRLLGDWTAVAQAVGALMGVLFAIGGAAWGVWKVSASRDERQQAEIDKLKLEAQSAQNGLQRRDDICGERTTAIKETLERHEKHFTAIYQKLDELPERVRRAVNGGRKE